MEASLVETVDIWLALLLNLLYGKGIFSTPCYDDHRSKALQLDRLMRRRA
jgi:hypothetical protein